MHRVLWKHRQPAIFSVYSTLQRRLHVAITLVLLGWLAVSISREMALMLWELLNNADLYFCYVIKTFITWSSKCEQKCDSFTQTHQSSIAPYHKFISCYFIFWGEPCHFCFPTRESYHRCIIWDVRKRLYMYNQWSDSFFFF